LLKIGDFTDFGKFDENSMDKRIQEHKKLINYIKKSAQLGNHDKFVECIQFVDKALTIDPKNIDALSIKSSAFFKLQKYEECIFFFTDKLLEIDPKDIDALIIKSKALFNLQKHEKCNSIANKILTIDPNNEDAL